MKQGTIHPFYSSGSYTANITFSPIKRTFSRIGNTSCDPGHSIDLIKVEAKIFCLDNDYPQPEPNILALILCSSIKDPIVNKAILGHEWNPSGTNQAFKQAFITLLQKSDEIDSKPRSPSQPNESSTPETSSPSSSCNMNTIPPFKEAADRILFISDLEKYNSRMRSVVEEIKSIKQSEIEIGRIKSEAEQKLRECSIAMASKLHQLEIKRMQQKMLREHFISEEV